MKATIQTIKQTKNYIYKNIEKLASKYPEHYELTYTMPYETEEDIRRAVELRTDLYDKFNSVQVYPNGLYKVRITASNK